MTRSAFGNLQETTHTPHLTSQIWVSINSIAIQVVYTNMKTSEDGESCLEFYVVALISLKLSH